MESEWNEENYPSPKQQQHQKVLPHIITEILAIVLIPQKAGPLKSLSCVFQ